VLALETNGTSHKSGSFTITGADGEKLQIPAGDYYFNTKARCRRLMQNSLSSDARRVYACLEAATMFWKRELALANNGQPLTPTDIVEQTGLIKQHVTAALRELEEQGLAERRSDDGGELRRGHILIYSWAVPQPPQEEDSNCAQLQSSLQFPDWFPESWESLKPLIKRLRVRLDTELVTARSSIIEEGAEIARCYEEAEKRVRALLERVSAQDDLYKEDRKYRNTDRTEEREGRKATSSIEESEQPRSSPPSPPVPPSPPAAEPHEVAIVPSEIHGKNGDGNGENEMAGSIRGRSALPRQLLAAASGGTSEPSSSGSERSTPPGGSRRDKVSEPDGVVRLAQAGSGCDRTEAQVLNKNSEFLWNAWRGIMEGCGRPVSVRSNAACRQVFFRYPPETQQRIVQDATIRSQTPGKWDGPGYTTDPLKYLKSEIWDIAPITARKFAPVRPPTQKEEADAVMRAHIERARQRDRERNGSGV
jgi:MarR family